MKSNKKTYFDNSDKNYETVLNVSQDKISLINGKDLIIFIIEIEAIILTDELNTLATASSAKSGGYSETVHNIFS